MALQSQAPRAGTGRRQTTTTRRKKSLAPWLALLGVVVIVGGLILIFSGGDDLANASPQAGDKADASKDGANRAADRNAAGAISGQAPNRTGQTDSPRTTTPPTQTTGPAHQQAIYTGPEAIATLNDTERRSLDGAAKDKFETGMERIAAGDLVTGRAMLSELLFLDGALPRHEAKEVRDLLEQLNQQHVLSKSNRSSEQIAADPIVALHKVQSGEYLSTIANTYRTPYQLIERINNIDARKLQAGQALQVIKGPVHARIDKSEYRMDLYIVDDAGLPIFLKSYTVGLGEFDSTPVGQYRIKPGSKVGPDAANGKGPSWRNPRTGKVYTSEDPDIPIGEYWMALEGMDENTKGKSGYGIHATNDPESIGRQESMGCIRMRDEDVDEVFYTLFEGASTVQIVP